MSESEGRPAGVDRAEAQVAAAEYVRLADGGRVARLRLQVFGRWGCERATVLLGGLRHDQPHPGLGAGRRGR